MFFNVFSIPVLIRIQASWLSLSVLPVIQLSDTLFFLNHPLHLVVQAGSQVSACSEGFHHHTEQDTMKTDARQDEEHAAQGVFVHEPPDQRRKDSVPEASAQGYNGKCQVASFLEGGAADDKNGHEAAWHPHSWKEIRKQVVVVVFVVVVRVAGSSLLYR